ncbi:MAG: hypothetical protein QXV16_00965 [Candidatus Anstonellales archaeon]
MIIPPEQAIDRIVYEYLSKDLQIQQAGIDVTLKEIHYFVGYGSLDLDNKNRRLAKTIPIEIEGKEHIAPGVYKIKLNEYFKLDRKTIGILFPRTTLLRNGVAIYAGLFDPGFEGYAEVLMHVINPNGVEIYENARIGQIVFIKNTKLLGEYRGIYKKSK